MRGKKASLLIVGLVVVLAMPPGSGSHPGAPGGGNLDAWVDVHGDAMSGTLAFTANQGIQFTGGQLTGTPDLRFAGSPVCLGVTPVNPNPTPGCAGGDITGVAAGAGLAGGGASGDVTVSVNLASGGGLTFSTQGAGGVAIQPCAPGEVLERSPVGAWVCRPRPTAKAGGGLAQGSANEFGLIDCEAGEVVAKAGGGVPAPEWECLVEPWRTPASIPRTNNFAVLDGAGDVGSHTDMTIDGAWRAVISYYDATNGDLKVARCANARCTSATVTTVDSTGDVGQFSSIAVLEEVGILNPQWLPAIAYYDATNQDLKFVKCGNRACATANVIRTIDSGGHVGQYVSLAVGTDGNPVMAYFDATSGDLKVAKCSAQDCSPTSVVTTVLDVGQTGAVVGKFASLRVDLEGRPVVAYYDETNGNLNLVHCGTPDCTGTANVFTVVDAGGPTGTDDVGRGASLRLVVPPDPEVASALVPVVAYFDATNEALKLVKCGNLDCTPGAATSSWGQGTLWQDPEIGAESAGAARSDGEVFAGRVHVAAHDATSGNLVLFNCHLRASVFCDDRPVDVVGDVGGFPSISTTVDGDPVIAYRDNSNANLKVALCANPHCVSRWSQG